VVWLPRRVPLVGDFELTAPRIEGKPMILCDRRLLEW